jgi:hypothetical protein
MGLSGLVGAGAQAGLEQVLERRLKEAIRQQQAQQHADQLAMQREQMGMQREQMAGVNADRQANREHQRQLIDIANLQRVDQQAQKATDRNVGLDAANVLNMPGMSREAQAGELQQSVLRNPNASSAPGMLKIIEGLTKVPDKVQYTYTDPKTGQKSLRFAPKDQVEGGVDMGREPDKPTAAPRPGTHVIDGSLVDDNGRVIYTGGKGKGKDGGGSSPYATEHSAEVVRKINDLIGDPADPKAKNRINNRTAGVVGSALASLPFQTDARDVNAELESLAANLAFGQLQKMRDASKTGGALGSVAVEELKLLKNAEASIRQDQSPTNLTRQLGIIRDSANRFVEAAGAVGGLDPMRPASSRDGAAPGAAPKRLRFDAKGNPIP